MTTKADIFNATLVLMGVTPDVESDTEKTKKAKTLNAIWDFSRKFVLKAHDWGFAKKYYNLVEVGTAPVSWAYQYKFPNDMLKPRYIEQANRRADELPYEIAQYEDADNGLIKVIRCDISAAVMVGTANVTDLSIFTEEFIDPLSGYMAFKGVRPFSDSKTFQRELLNGYKESLANGAHIDALSEADDPEQDADWIRARGGGVAPLPQVIGE